MKLLSSIFVLSLAVTSVLAATSEGGSNAQPAAAVLPLEDPAYTRAIEGRTADILKLLELKDEAKSTAVHDVIMAQYRALMAWHNANDAKRKELNKQSNGKDTNLAAQAKVDLGKIQDSLKVVHDHFLAKLSEQLTPAQVETVKDKMTYFKVKVTYDAYLQIYPGLTEEHKGKILDWLKEARELAMDGGSSEEKSEIFGKYKGRINNYLSKQGIKSTEQQAKEKAKAAEPAAK